MKKVNLMFSAIAVVAVVAGSMAFKAKTFTRETLYTGTVLSNTCRTQTLLVTPAASGTDILYTTTTTGTGCVTGPITTKEPV